MRNIKDKATRIFARICLIVMEHLLDVVFQMYVSLLMF